MCRAFQAEFCEVILESNGVITSGICTEMCEYFALHVLHGFEPSKGLNICDNQCKNHLYILYAHVL